MWHLAADPSLPEGPRSVVFISGAGGHVAMWAQRAGAPVLWDYHVVLLIGAHVYDLDSTLPFPVPLRAYLESSFPPAVPLPRVLRPRFRVVDAAEFRATFASDRSHMRDAPVPPPPWPAIRTDASAMNLPAFVDMTRPGPGELMNLAALGARG